MSPPSRVAILGGGVAGLSVAYFLRQRGVEVTVFEADAVVGGLARSFRWHDVDCDLAPHRFYSDDAALLAEIDALVPMDAFRRRSRIRLRGRWIQDPVNGAEILLKFLPAQSGRILWHYLRRPRRPEDSFEDMVLNQFGAGLNELFFKPYSEKLFGIPADQISPEWGRRKIRVAGIKDMLQRRSRLYFQSFHYPRDGGYGAICDALHARVADAVRLETRVVSLTPAPGGQGGYACTVERGGLRAEAAFDAVVATLPVTQVAAFLGARLALNFRAADVYHLLVDTPRVSPNHWMYFADASFCLNRISEFLNFHHAPSVTDRTVLCCEVTDTARGSVERVVEELASVGLLTSRAVRDARVTHLRHAYPIYDRASDAELARAEGLFRAHPHLHLLGRSAQFAHRDVDEIYAEAREVAQRVAEGAPATGMGAAEPA